MGASKHAGVLTIYKILLIYICCASVGLDNKYVMNVLCFHLNTILNKIYLKVCTYFHLLDNQQIFYCIHIVQNVLFSTVHLQ